MTTADSLRRIHIAAALITRADGKVLLVRKRGTTAFMQPGGKLEPGEAVETALRRELGEELRLTGTIGAPDYLGRFTAPAANEAGAVVEAEIFVLELVGDAVPQAEIEALCWVDPEVPGEIDLAPLTRDEVLPAWLRRRR